MKRMFTSKPTLLVILCCLLLTSLSLPSYAQTATWLGSVSSDYNTPANWDPSTFNPYDAGSTSLTIGAGNPNNPVQSGDNSNPIARRPAKLNTTVNAYLKVTGKLYPSNSDVLNGTIDISNGGDFNVRNVAFVGNGGKGTVNVTTDGTFSSKNAMYIGRNAGGNGVLNVWGGSVYATDIQVATNGASGLISFKTVSGSINVSGDKRNYFQTLVSTGKMIIEAGRTFDIVYNATANTTVVSVYQDPNSLIREVAESVILNNGIVKATITKNTGEITSLIYKGLEMVSTSGNKTNVYYDWTSSYGFEKMFNCTFSVKKLTDSIADVSFKRVFTPETGHVTPADMDIHFVLRKGDTGLYTYSILEHQPAYPKVDLGSWRMVWWLGNDGQKNVCEKMYVDSLRHWEMPSPYDYANGEATGIPEIIKLKTGVRAGKYDGKYEYSKQLWEQDVMGHASDINKVGIWFVYASHEFVNDGPTYSDLNGAAGILHAILNGVHYNASGFEIPQGEYWRKIYGPFMVYFNDKNTGDEAWADAQAKAVEEKKKWPYEWLDKVDEYPLKNARGSISGKFVVTDPYKSALNGANAWIGVTQYGANNTQQNWQFESKNYHYWVKTDANGNFTIPNVRPGTYILSALKTGATGEFELKNVSVSAGKTTNLGTLTWNIPRKNGQIAWEIGIPDRLAKEYKNGDFNYCEGFIWNQFAKQFKNPIEYNTKDNNWQSVLNYAHSPYPDSTKGLQTWNWRLNFNLPAGLPTTGNATLTVAYASADHASQFIYVNNESSRFTNYYPDNSEGNALLRQDNHAKYALSTITIPISKLVAGKNTITMAMPSTQAMANHVMYDYLSLEIPGITKAKFTSTPNTSKAKIPVIFDASTSIHSENSALTYAWDFGDGSVGSGQNISHSFKVGTYKTRLIVTDNYGAKDTTYATITALNNNPTAQVTANSTQGNAPFSVSFDASASKDLDDDALSYAWNFGDGSTGAGQQINHTFKSAGNFSVKLIVSDTRGGSDTTAVTITSNLVTGIETEINAIDVMVIPNPSTGETITLKTTLTEPSTVHYSLYDVNGKELISQNLGKQASGDWTQLVNVSPIPNGVYLLKLRVGNTIKTVKIIRQ